MNQRARYPEVPWVEAVGDHTPAALPLQGVVADGVGGFEGFVDVAGLELPPFLGVVGPDASVAVGLELEAHAHRGGAFVVAALMHLAAGAIEALQVVADLVGDDVGGGEVAGGAKAAGQLVEEREVEVGLVVAGAIKRAAGGGGKATRALHLAAKEDQLRLLVARQQAVPGVFGAAEDLADKDRGRVVAGGGRRLRRRRRRAATRDLGQE